MKKLVIIGAGGFAFECYTYIMQRIASGDKEISFKGFIANDGGKNLVQYNLNKFYLGDYDKISLSKDDYYIIAIGSASGRKKIYNQYKENGYKFYNLVAPNAIVLPNVLEQGEANIFCSFCNVTSVKFGNANIINTYSSCNHDSQIGNYNVISSYCDLTGFTEIGDCNFLDSHSFLLPHTKIGDNNSISAGSCVTHSISNNFTLQGNPARVFLSKEPKKIKEKTNFENTQIENKVIEIFSTILNKQISIEDNISMNNTEEWDSLKHIEIIITLEEELDISFNNEDISNLTSIKTIIEKIQELKK